MSVSINDTKVQGIKEKADLENKVEELKTRIMKFKA
jgi:hypothetical protein